MKAWIARTPDIELHVSAITVMEARKGFAGIRARAANQAAIEVVHGYEDDFRAVLDGFGDRIIPVDRAVAERWGEMLGEREANVMDAAVAATAWVFGLAVATRNLRHFRGRGVALLDPFKASPAIVGDDSA